MHNDYINIYNNLVKLTRNKSLYLSLKNNDQRAIIEQLLGITLLSEKAERLREDMKRNRDDAKEEEFRIQGVEKANEHIKEQIENLKRRSKMWEDNKDQQIQKLEKAIIDLGDVDNVIEEFSELPEYENKSEGFLKIRNHLVYPLNNTYEKSLKDTQHYLP